MLTEELRARLARLYRAPSVAPARFETPESSLAALVPGEVVQHEDGQFYRVRRHIAQLHATGLAELACARQLAGPQAPPDSELHAFDQAFPDRTLFLDVETCGFSGTPLFLVGLLRSLDGEMFVEQLLARDYAEEPAVLRYFWKTLALHDVLITFNGKSFDWPFVVDRSTCHRLTIHGSSTPASTAYADAFGLRRLDAALDGFPLHCDMLHLSRRHWKRRYGLPNCRLQTLEAALCGRYRRGDIPSYMIGDIYHRFVRTGDARHIEQILQHNAVDLITLAQLALLLQRDLADLEADSDAPLLRMRA
jgi:uncharacterized protein YprB with RNaseH-like and TPR domain